MTVLAFNYVSRSLTCLTLVNNIEARNYQIGILRIFVNISPITTEHYLFKELNWPHRIQFKSRMAQLFIAIHYNHFWFCY
ncbi:unnamed protein product [Paramecium octaurelia]|uniref:Uncharacterized protein n=1 Tax=Paramecium octaurelia TaxID=43137 RepID=A0A8S1UA16_PAROT|nr:unnamed protein product [Paramecium octaurelia]